MQKCAPLFLAFSFLLLAASCTQKEGEPVDLGHAYYPAEPGHWVIYDVDSLFYDDFTGQTLHYQYQVKELAESVFIDEQGVHRIRIQRCWRQNPGDPWQVKNVWQARLMPSRLERTEENITYIPLAFPPGPGNTWNGNAYNTKEPQQYRYTSVHEPYQVNSHSFDSTLTVLQKELVTLISEDFQQQVYARHVGMIYKKFVQLTKQVDGTIVKGTDYSYSISAFGKE